MFRIIEILGAVAPLAALALLIVYRKPLPSLSLTLGVIGCVLATLNVLVGFLGKRLLPFGAFGGGGLDGVLGWIGTVAALRTGLLVVAILLLVIAAFHGRSETARILPWLLGAGVPLVVGLLLPLPIAEFEHQLIAQGREGLAVMATLIGEAVQFAALGVGILGLAVAITTGRRSSSAQQRDSATLVRDTTRSAWAAYRAIRR